MLSKQTPVPTLAVSDLSRARGFYENTLGLTAEREEPGGVTYPCGSGNLFVYSSAYAGTNKATAVTFDIPAADFDNEVDELRGKGVEFMTFEMDGMEWNDGVATLGEGIRAVWFADPDGNILNISVNEL